MNRGLAAESFAEKVSVGIIVPIRTVSEVNSRDHWAVKAKRTSKIRAAVRVVLVASGIHAPPFPLVVTLTRIAPRELDDDNLRSALKAVRDSVSDWLGLKSDRDPRVKWCYAQTRGRPREYAVRVDFTSRAAS